MTGWRLERVCARCRTEGRLHGLWTGGKEARQIEAGLEEVGTCWRHHWGEGGFFIDGYADRTDEREAGQEGSRTGEMHVSLQAKVKLKFSYTFGPKVPRPKLFISVVDPE